jgi:hypothetical protein
VGRNTALEKASVWRNALAELVVVNEPSASDGPGRTVRPEVGDVFGMSIISFFEREEGIEISDIVRSRYRDGCVLWWFIWQERVRLWVN